MENVKKLHWHELNVPKAFGLSVSSRMLEIEARLLPTPVVKYGRGTETRGPESGFWNLRGKQLLMPSSFVSYGVSYLPAGRGVNDQVLQGLTRNLVTSLAGLGLGAPIGQPPAFILGNPQGDLNEMIQALFAKTGNLFKRKPELFIFLVHQDCTAAIYKVLKNLCERQFGVASQVENANSIDSLQIANLAIIGHGSREGAKGEGPNAVSWKCRPQDQFEAWWP